ncbi:cadherin repeat domain-containing protein [Sinimarinibacterium sp. CAU 1509]|uniref:cadherin repeat domain-containing protein n=1 Tax=Sinimarinibacterium sp. CAU 1509 TaxID=2562283 RepID=UPI0010AD1446|nr:cadherin repeat domain-containing protein [Sinimarinibacterium sp. CAU 1509]TJY58979.1 cadherin repeat domain-containing protein [Sinimarinibacterium sp. CAU 1509]
MAKEVGGQSEMNAPIRDTKTSEQDLLLKKKLVADVTAAETEARGGDADVAANTAAQSAEVTTAVAGGLEVASVGVDGESASDADSGFPTWAVVGGAAVVAGAGIALASDNNDNNNNNNNNNDNTDPTITSASTFAVDENTTSVGTLTGADADGDVLTFSIVGGADANAFVLNGQTLSFINAPDFESGKTSYTVQVQVEDGNGGTATQTITVNVNDVDETPPPDVTKTLTTGVDVIQMNPGDVVSGDETTLTSGDKISGPGLLSLSLTGAGVFSGQTVSNVNGVEVSSVGGLDLLASKWTGVPTITIFNSKDDVTLSDLQSTGTNFVLEDHVDATGVITLNFDAQATAGATEVDVSVSEIQDGGLVLNGGAIETLNLEIADAAANAASTLGMLDVTGISTLNITGGSAGFGFEITDALNAGLDVLDASTAASDLTLSIEDSVEAIDVALGSGDDVLFTGDTMGPLAEQDTFDGGAGYDTLFATFDTDGTRHPVSTGFEHFDLTFNNDAKLDMGEVDDVQTITIEESAAHFEIVDMDSTVDFIHIIGQQAFEDQELRWDGTGADAEILWTNDSGASAAFNNFLVLGAEKLVFATDGDDDVYFNYLYLDGGLTDLTFEVRDNGDFYVYDTYGTYGVENLTIQTLDSGDFYIDDIYYLDSLVNLTVMSSEAGEIRIEDLGGTGNARELETVTIIANATANQFVYGTSIRSLDAGFDSFGASISTFTVEVGDDAEASLFYAGLYVQDISDMTISLQQDSDLYFGAIYMYDSGDELVVSGQGYLNNVVGGYDFYFAAEAFDTMDFSGLTNDGVDLYFATATAGSDVYGTANGDFIYSGLGNDLVVGNGGYADLVYDAGGNNVFVMSGGASEVYMFGVGYNDFVQMDGTSILLDPGSVFNDYIGGFEPNFDQVAFTGGPEGSIANYQEGAAANYAAALAQADAALNGAGDVYYFAEVGGTSYLFYDQDSDGNSDVYVEIVGATQANFGFDDIAPGTL